MSSRTHRARTLGLLSVLCLALTAAAGPDDVSVVAATYRRLLEQYADGREEAALRQLISLETRLLEAGWELERLREAEIDLIEELLPGGARALLPVIALHESAYLAYQAEGSAAHAFHARTIMFQLCESFADTSTSPGGRQLAGDLFATLGGYFQQTSTGSTAIRLFARSLTLDPANEAALLGAATTEEQRGRYLNSLRFLSRLTQSHPENFEGQLRRAINLDRTARRSEAIYLLESLLDGEAPRWILILAHQALARSLIDQNRWEDARGVLTRGVERFPDDPTLAIALAYTADRLAAQVSAPDLVAALQKALLADQTPPRLRYSHAPVELFEQARSHWRQTSRESYATLAAVLTADRSP